MNKKEFRKLVQEEIKNVLKENKEPIKEIIDPVSMVLVGALIGAVGGTAVGYVGNQADWSIEGLKNLWKQYKDNKELAKIADRIKTDPEVQDFLKNPRKRGWQKMIATKLTPEEQKYVNTLTRNKF